ncbi:MAG: hypothetical protein RIR48_2779 [Bacteroidota bacterium]
MIRCFSFIVIFLMLSSCRSKNRNDLVLTNDQLVHAMVEMYTINAALEINDATFRDSMSIVYFNKISEITGHSPEVIRKDFDKLVQMPDSLLMIQGRAMDTLRHLVEKSISTPSISIGLQ